MTDATIDSPWLHVGAYAICVRDGQMLMVRMAPTETAAGLWGLPGGGLNWGEDPEDGVLRELTEETGLSGIVAGLAGIFSAAYLRGPDRPRHSMHHLGILYFVETLPGEICYEQDGSTDQCAWISLDEVARLPLVPVAELGLGLYAAAKPA